MSRSRRSRSRRSRRRSSSRRREAVAGAGGAGTERGGAGAAIELYKTVRRRKRRYLDGALNREESAD